MRLFRNSAVAIGLLAVGLMGASLVGGGWAWACSCAPPPPPKEALANAQAVFAGKVVKVEDVGQFEREATFEVTGWWKGGEAARVAVVTARDSATCGYGFQKDKVYLVYCFRSEGKTLRTNICTRTTPWENAQQDRADLGPGKPPQPAAGE